MAHANRKRLPVYAKCSTGSVFQTLISQRLCDALQMTALVLKFLVANMPLKNCVQTDRSAPGPWRKEHLGLEYQRQAIQQRHESTFLLLRFCVLSKSFSGDLLVKLFLYLGSKRIVSLILPQSQFHLLLPFSRHQSRL